MTTDPISPSRGRHESERLTRALLDLAAAGLRTHCSDPATHHLNKRFSVRALIFR